MDQPKSALYPTQQTGACAEQGPAVYYQPQPPMGPPPPGYFDQLPPGQQQYMVVPQQQQQPTVVVIAAAPGKSYNMHLALACCAFWCCGGLFGLAAFFIALCAQSSSASNPQRADLLGKISMLLSGFGLVIGFIVFIYYLVNIIMGAHWLYVIINAQNGTDWSDFGEGNWARNGTHSRNITRVY